MHVSTHRRAAVAAAASIWLVVTGAARPASACSIELIEIAVDNVPEPMAANTVIHVTGELYSTYELHAFVDGEPWGLLEKEARRRPWPLAVLLDPLPPAGAEVVVTATRQSSEIELLRRTLVEADTHAPALPSEPELSGHLQPFALEVVCGSAAQGDGVLYASAVAEPGDVGARNFLEVEILLHDDVLSRAQLPVTGETTRTESSHVYHASPAVDPLDLCARFTAFDDAYNASEPVLVCGPCHLKPGSGEVSSTWPRKPSFSDEDIARGGRCDDGTLPPLSPLPPLPPSGCGCAAVDPVGTLLGGALALTALARRRRRRPRDDG